MKATVVSICNFPIKNEYKPSVNPAYYSIEAADPKLGIATLLVEDGFSDIYLGEDRCIRVPVAALEIANAFVNDYAIAQLQIQNGAGPGLFAIAGDHSPQDILKNCKEEIKKAKEKHIKWAKQLITMADDLWSLKKQRRMITQAMCDAVRFLGLTREWSDLSALDPEEVNVCPACKTSLAPDVIICNVCRCVIDKERAANLEFA